MTEGRQMIWLTPFVGAILLLTLVGDVYATVFVPRGPVGPLSRRLYAASWAGWNRFGDHLPPDRRRRWLALNGPLLVLLTVMVWGRSWSRATRCSTIPGPGRFSSPRPKREGFLPG